MGQKFIRLLADHPWFEVAAVAASVGQRREALRGRGPMAGAGGPPGPRSPSWWCGSACRHCRDRIVFSALDAEVAGPIEQEFARAGAYVVTNTRTHRMDADVPLLIPEANADHLALIDRQREDRGAGTVPSWPTPTARPPRLALALAPLHRAFGVERLFVSTMQAVSGAGYPGVASLDIVGNVIPHIGGEEEKIERESRKILGTLGQAGVEPAGKFASAPTPTASRWWMVT